MDFFSAAKERPEQFKTGGDTLAEVNDRFGAAQRQAVRGAQDAASIAQVVDAAKSGFLNPEQAATWSDVAKRAGVENKYALAAAPLIGTLAEVDLMPGPNVNAAKKEMKVLGNTLQDLNKDGKIVAKAMDTAGQEARLAAKADQEFSMAAKATEKAPVQGVIKFKDVQAKETAKDFVKKHIKAELDAQPALKRDPAYLKERIRNLFNFFIKQNGG